MAFCDFVVKCYEGDSEELIAKRILYSIWIKRLKSKKPVVVFMGGESGEGKSTTVCRLMEILLEVQGVELTPDSFRLMNVITPFEYPEKMQSHLNDKKWRKYNLFAMHEAREIVKAKQWQSFMSQTVADVNAMSRKVKRLMTFIVSQFIKDVTRETRYTLNYYCIARRPKGKACRLYINVMWKDDRDLESPRLRKRKLSGYLVDERGRYRRFVPQYFEFSLPQKWVVDLFDEMDYSGKKAILDKKLSELLSEMRLSSGVGGDKIAQLVDFYVSRHELIGKVSRGKWRLSKEYSEMHELSKVEVKRFEVLLGERLKKSVVNDDFVEEDDLDE